MTSPDVFALPARPQTVRALRIALGHTRKRDIVAFCAEADVGASVGDDADLRWVYLDGAEARDGDWIVELPHGEFAIMPNHLLSALFDTREADVLPASTRRMIRGLADELRQTAAVRRP